MLKQKGSSEPRIQLGALNFKTEEEARQHAAANLHGKIVIIHSPNKENMAGNEYYIEDPGTMVRSWEKVVYEGFASKAAVAKSKSGVSKSPWSVRPEDKYNAPEIHDADGHQIAVVYGEGKEQRDANARMMAAATKQHESLLMLIARLDQTLKIARGLGTLFRAEAADEIKAARAVVEGR